MAEYRAIPDEVLEPGRPIRSLDGFALRDNPLAIASGASGAPRIQTPALADQSVTTAKLGDWSVTVVKIDGGVWAEMINRIAALDVGTVGSYAFMQGPHDTRPGQTAAGSNLKYSNAAANSHSTSVYGTWRCMGYAAPSYPDGELNKATTLWLRVA